MENFQSLGLPEALSNALAAMQFTAPTPIQAQTIPFALQGLDVLGTAQTGTGKTAAYGIPLISHLLNSQEGTALVLTPTRELASQVLAALQQMLGKKTSIKTALIIGGDSMDKQLNQLRQNPRIVVGTPGRLNDHLSRGTLKLDKAGFLVLDETDRMLDMGFGIQIEQIAEFLPYKRQTLMFSATLPSNIQNLSSQYLKDAKRVSIGSTISAADTIKQETIRTTESDKHGILLEQLDIHNGSCIVFVKTKMATERLATKLRDHGHTADAIHGDLRQRHREKVIRCFRARKNRILVATDVAARGLDIPHIECVLNYDLPQCEEDFIHRIGRTGRAGSEGTAVSLITPQDHLKWRNIHRMMNPGVKLDSSFDDPRGMSKGRDGRRRSPSSGGFRSDRPSFRRNDERRPARSDSNGFKSDRPSFRNNDERKPARSDSNGFRSDRPAFRNNDERRPARSDSNGFKSDRPSFRNNDERRPARSDSNGFRSDRPSFRNNDERRPARSDSNGFKSDRPSFRNNEARRPARSDSNGFKSDRPAFRNNDERRPARSESNGSRNDRSAFRNDRPSFKSDKPSFRSEKPSFKTNDGRPSSKPSSNKFRKFGDSDRNGNSRKEETSKNRSASSFFGDSQRKFKPRSFNTAN
jgi:ATP-dependent RNA helicase DeaD